MKRSWIMFESTVMSKSVTFPKFGFQSGINMFFIGSPFHFEFFS